MKTLLMLAVLSLSARAAETKMPPAVAAARFYAQARTINALVFSHRVITERVVEYAEKSNFQAMFYSSSMAGNLDFHTNGNKLTQAVADLPAKPSPDAASRTLMALADQELAEAEKNSTEATARVDGAREKINQNETATPSSERGGVPSAKHMFDMLLWPVHNLPIAQARAAATRKAPAAKKP